MANKRLREEIYDTARGLHDLGLVDGETLREFHASRLPALKPYGAADIKRTYSGELLPNMIDICKERK